MAHTSLEDVVFNFHHGECICRCLDAHDVVNWAATNRRFRHWINNDVNAMLRSWWKDQQVLSILGCERGLLSKICKTYHSTSSQSSSATSASVSSQSSFNWRIVETRGSHIIPETNIISLFQHRTKHLFGVPSASFADLTAEEADWMNYPQHVKDQLSPIMQQQQRQQNQQFKRIRMQCRWCSAAANDIDDVHFYVANNSYCSTCMDDHVYLRIRFGAEHGIGSEHTSWAVEEKDMRAELYDGLADDEYSVSFFEFTSSGPMVNYWFIGKGPRNPDVTYTTRPLDRAQK